MKLEVNLLVGESTSDARAVQIVDNRFLFFYSVFISRSVYARSQVSVCSGHDLCHPG